MSAEEATNYFKLVMGVRVMGRPFALAGGVPADRVKALKAAFVATAKDAKFKAEADKMHRDVELVTGDEIQAIVADMARTPKEQLAKLDDLLKFKGVSETAKVELPTHTGKVTKTGEGGRSVTVNAGGKDDQRRNLGLAHQGDRGRQGGQARRHQGRDDLHRHPALARRQGSDEGGLQGLRKPG